MRHQVDLIEAVPRICYSDLVRRAGGRRKLRTAGRWTVLVAGPAGEQEVLIGIAEQPMRLGGSRSYLLCGCGRRAMQLLWDAREGRFRCRRCWGPTKLRYASQEKRRIRARGTEERCQE